MQLDRPFDKEFLNRGLISVRPHGDAAEKEYKSTIEMLGDNVNRINVGQITTDIQKKYPFKKEVPERSIKNMNLRQIETTFGKPLRQLMEDYNVKSEAIGNTYCYFIEGSNYVHSTKLDALVEAIEDKEGSQTSSGKQHTVTIQNYQEHLNYLESITDDCGCDERKEKFNKIPVWSRRKVRCIERDDYIWLTYILENNMTKFTFEDRSRVVDIYNHVFRTKVRNTKCSPCIKGYLESLQDYIDIYDN